MDQDCLLWILISLIGFFIIVIIYMKHFYKKQKESFEEVDFMYNTITPDLPPVNRNVEKAQVLTNIPASQDLYNKGTENYMILDTEPEPNTNQLLYSGGNAQIISIPLQMNNPNENESLRSQQILITDYNRIKYCVQ